MTKLELKKEIITTLISSIIFAIILIIGVVGIINIMYGNNLKPTEVGDLLVDFNQSNNIEMLPKTLTKQEGIKEDNYEITVTNNTNKNQKYTFYIKNNSDDKFQEDLFLSLSSIIIKSVIRFPEDEDLYIIHTGEVKPGTSLIINFTLWYESEYPDNLENQEIDIEYGILNR